MENTLENKAKFFAQYYGQEVLFSEEYNTKYPSPLHYIAKPYLNRYCLLLKPIASITYEDSIEVSRIWTGNEYENGKEIIEDLKGIEHRYPTDMSDYLRSKGYALPYLGVSIEEQVKRGWIKLIQQRDE